MLNKMFVTHATGFKGQLFYTNKNNKNALWKLLWNTLLKNTKISTNFLVWKFCGTARFPQGFGWYPGTAIIFFQYNIVGLKPGNPVEIWYIFTQGLFVRTPMDSYSRKVHFHYYEVDVTRISNTYKFLIH